MPSIGAAGELFRYDFSRNDALSYKISINSKIEFSELGGLAQLLNINKINHNVYIDTDLEVESIDSDGNALIKAVFRKISMIAIIGDSVFTDDGSNWGALKTGSEYKFTMAPNGEIIDAYGQDSLMTRQGGQLLQRFFPVFPENAVEPGHTWSDSLNFEVEMSGNQPVEVLSQIAYYYIGNENGGDSSWHYFEFSINGSSLNQKSIVLSGEGFFYFDINRGKIIENSGDLAIDALLDLAAFGLPAGLGSGVPASIQSEIEIKLNDND